MGEYCIFWGETHDNTYVSDPSPAPIGEVIGRAAAHLDFYAAAYYTSCASAFRAGGHVSESDGPHDIVLEGWKAADRLEREWAEVQAATREANVPGRFVTFPGYEWQGDGSSGDHNVIAREEGLPIFRVETLAELYDKLHDELHDEPLREAIAIPHHTAYRPGVRGRDWSVFDEDLSPFAEVFSVHGCSETDEEWVGLRRNSHMGPGVKGGTYQDALDRGHHLGAICSTDNWGVMPGHYGHGRAACLASELTREGLWEAFRSRRVYGVTGDRIELDFRIRQDGGKAAVMGEAVAIRGPRNIRVRVRGADAIDRIELLRRGRVIATHCHQGTWRVPEPGEKSRFKIRIEAGWGPRQGELSVPDRRWEGELMVPGGRVIGFEPCWISPGQERPLVRGERATFRMLTSTATVSDPHQNANVFELEADPGAELLVRMNGLEERARLGELARGSRLMTFRDECVAMLRERCGIEPGSPEREDVYNFVAFKVKLHRAIPEEGYEALLEFVDEEPLEGEADYRVRVEQRNGQRAWSSPIWVSPGC